LQRIFSYVGVYGRGTRIMIPGTYSTFSFTNTMGNHFYEGWDGWEWNGNENEFHEFTHQMIMRNDAIDSLFFLFSFPVPFHQC
jgi:hypothetical protein